VNGACAWPVPAGVATVIQLALLDAVHGQPAPVVTDAALISPAGPTSRAVGATLYVQPFACDTESVCPAIETFPSRAGPEFAAIENGTCPGPLPLEPAPMVIHGDPLAADQAQPGAAATWNAPVVAAGPTLTLGGLTVNVQPELWLTVTA
jgi:hypothetical protein